MKVVRFYGGSEPPPYEWALVHPQDLQMNETDNKHEFNGTG